MLEIFQCFPNVSIRVHGFVLKYWRDDSPCTYNTPHSELYVIQRNLMNSVGIFVTPDSCVLRIYITVYVKVYLIDYEQQLNIYETILHIFHHLNPLWSISRFKVMHNSISI
jgi:hypothetical protein